MGYLISIAELVNSVQKVALINNYGILGLRWEVDFIYLFDSHSKNEIGNL